MISNGLVNNAPSVYQDDPGFLPVPSAFTVGSAQADGNGQYICLPICVTAQMSNVKLVSEFTTLYDRYTINYVTLKIRMNKGLEDNNSNWPRLEWCFDRDDNQIDSLVVWEQRLRHSFQFSESNRVCTIRFKPTILLSSYIANQIGQSFDRVAPFGWHNLQGTGINVMGLGCKLFLRDWFLAANGTVAPDPIDVITITPEYHFALKDVR